MERQELDKLVMKPTSRRRLGKYVILGRLGAGGMGKIYLAFLPGPAGIEKLVVIKRLHSHLTGDRLLVESFLDEARLAMAISHPNVVHTYDVGEVDGRYYMAMEHIDGQNLGALLRTSKRAGKYPESSLWAGMFCAALDGLHAAHTARDARGRPLNIIHRDVSPQNILISYDGTPKLVDFGIAKAAMRINETDAGVLKGKYAYMSPEQCEAKDLDPRSDVFSAGVVFWEMLAGRRLYKSQHVVKSIDRILREPPITPVKYNADCDEKLAAIAVKALAKDPDERFSSADEFREAIEDALLAAGQRYRRGDLSALMRELFGDVIDRQRQLLDRVLSGEAVQGDDDDEDGAEGDSESDLLVPNLVPPGQEPEPTTPSALSHSPLVTRESEIGPNPRALRPEGPTPMTDDGHPPPRRPDKPPPRIGAEEGEDRTSTGTVSYAPVNDDDERPRAAWLWPMIIGLVLLLAGAAGGVIFLVMVNEDNALPTPREAADTPGPAPGDKATDPGAQGVADDDGDQPRPTDDDPADDPDPDDDDDADDDESPNATAPKDRDDDDDKKARNNRRRPKKTTRRARPSRDDNDDDKTTRTAKATNTDGDWDKKATEPKAPDPPPQPEKKAAAFGYLTLATVPWTTVYLDGKKLGNTPLNNVKVPAGELKLVLKNRTEAIEQPYIVRIKAGETTKKKLGLK